MCPWETRVNSKEINEYPDLLHNMWEWGWGGGWGVRIEVGEVGMEGGDRSGQVGWG